MSEETKSTLTMDVKGVQFTFPHTIKLTYPIDKGPDHDPISEVIINFPPTWKDCHSVKVGGDGEFPLDQLLPLTAKLSNVNIIDLGRMMPADAGKVIKFLNNFLAQ